MRCKTKGKSQELLKLSKKLEKCNFTVATSCNVSYTSELNLTLVSQCSNKTAKFIDQFKKCRSNGSCQCFEKLKSLVLSKEEEEDCNFTDMNIETTKVKKKCTASYADCNRAAKEVPHYLNVCFEVADRVLNALNTMLKEVNKKINPSRTQIKNNN